SSAAPDFWLASGGLLPHPDNPRVVFAVKLLIQRRECVPVRGPCALAGLQQKEVARAAPVSVGIATSPAAGGSNEVVGRRPVVEVVPRVELAGQRQVGWCVA